MRKTTTWILGAAWLLTSGLALGQSNIVNPHVRLACSATVTTNCTPQVSGAGVYVPPVPGALGGTVTSVGLVGTANQITVTGGSPITASGIWTLSFPVGGVTLPGTTTATLATLPVSKDTNIDAPSTVDSNKYHLTFPVAKTITRLQCSTNQGTVSVNYDVRAIATPNTPGIDVLSAVLVCDNDTQSSCASGCDVNTIVAGTVGAHLPINLQITATSGSPNVVRIHVEAQ